jgi:putative beta-barrel porin BBP2
MTISRIILISCVIAGVSAWPAPARAQAQIPEAIEAMPIHVGPLGLRPSLSITNVGNDSNVFNDAEHPQEDFTATVVPRLLARVRGGRMTLSYGSAADMVYFQKFTSERSVNSTTDIRLDANLGRLQPFASIGWVATRERLNAEIDLRTPRTQRTLAGGARMLLASRTAMVVSARRFTLDFDEGAIFKGVDLSRTLNSRTDSVDGSLQLLLTPLTTFSMTTSLQRDRFEAAPERDSDTLRLLPALQFDPTTLIRGSVAVGYRRFRPLTPNVPDYSGLLVQAGIGYTLLERTKFDLDLARDVQYSFEDVEPYYLSTGGRLTVTHQLVGPLDLQAFGGGQTMAYRQRGISGDVRRDQVRSYGGGAGYRLRNNMRLGVTWETNRRQSALADRDYVRRRIYASLTYGL